MIQAGDKLPHQQIFGSWRVCGFDSENINSYLKHIGVSFAIRLAAKNMSQDVKINDISSLSLAQIESGSKNTWGDPRSSSTISNNTSDKNSQSLTDGENNVLVGAGVHITTSTSLTSTDDVFYFNVPRNVCTKDGRKSTVCFSIVEMEDGTLAIEKVEKWMVKNKAMSAKILMFVDGKDQMVTRMECDGIVVNRVHKRF